MKEFINAVQEALGHAPSDVIADGEVHRFSTSEKKGDLSGWYVLYDEGDFQAAGFGDWRTDSSHTWCSRSASEFTAQERETHKKRMEEAKAKRQAKRVEVQAAAKAEAVKIWASAEDAPENHPYLEKKQVKPVAIRQVKHFGELCLVVPINIEGALTSLQFIKPDGGKRFLSGGEIKGGVCLLGQPDRILYVAEGYATAATLHAATGEAVAVVFNAGNMMQACRNLGKAFAGCNLVICADNDHTKERNVGLEKGREVSEKLCYRIVYP